MTDFVFREDPTFKWPVTVRYPGDSEIVEARFIAHFRAVPEDELFAPAKGLDADEATAVDLIAMDRERLAALVIGWEGISVVGGGALEFTLENLDMLLRQRPVRIALGAAYAEAMIEQGEARAKN